MTPRHALTHLWHLAGGDPAALERVDLDGGDPCLPSVHRIGTLAAASIAAAGLAAAECDRVRTARAQRVRVSVRHALAAFRSERYLRVDGRAPPEPRHPVTGFYETRDARWIQLHANFPHHLRGALDVLGCGEERAQVAAAVRGWDGDALEAALADAGLCAALIRSPEEWQAHEHARALARRPLVEIERTGDAPPRPIGADEGADEGPHAAGQPLSGVRVLDLTRIIAGPVAARTLAAHGAQTLVVTSPHLPNIPAFAIDNGRGKRAAFVDLRDAQGSATLDALASQADVFVQSYRPGALDARGFGAHDLARRHPGIVCVSVCAYGYDGPWASRRGFDSLVQSASGIAWVERRAAGGRAPRHLPCQALDHATGYLAAFGAMTALARRAREGGSWHVRVSLAQTGRWLQSFGIVEGGERVPDTTLDDVRDCLDDALASPFGAVRGVRHAETLSATPPRFSCGPAPFGRDAPRWLP
ncbi:CoA transferase [Burkholderia humptydooensis]|uniref:CoA transferase n=2 Tax=Burkholderia humptydooensis TaxID=430531 RepID=A0A7U4STA4_9BURK|nr:MULTISPECIES: CoA transferase [Burkholderia]AJY41632.1 coA-transferase III family protein [Burkholderia sp. 2002721687]ALX43517.1 carnitine dehydratase [Burkholderia humptydooensis]EIP90187.1 L-carnitine dehydratase/bile acid-inducible protein F [Burkholderia humptydooensis MSMB43]QPS44564.1 CoA transferase [Burkholderia humptydooensis]